MSERTNTIGVRGAFTAECLDLMGIHNYRIIGCPSMFVNLNGILPSIGRPTCGKYQITITPGNSYLKTKLLQLGMRSVSGSNSHGLKYLLFSCYVAKKC